MSTLVILGALVAFGAYVPLWQGIRAGKPQNLLTWILWGTLDAIITASIIKQDGNYLLPMIYTVGSTITGYLIWKSQGEMVWKRFHTLITILAVASMVIWYFSGVQNATIASSLAMMIGGIPQLEDAWEKPEDMPLIEYAFFTLANFLSMMGGKSWAIEEWFYAFTATVFCFVMVVCSSRKYLPAVPVLDHGEMY
jgi:hypothetical protein